MINITICYYICDVIFLLTRGRQRINCFFVSYEYEKNTIENNFMMVDVTVIL